MYEPLVYAVRHWGKGSWTQHHQVRVKKRTAVQKQEAISNMTGLDALFCLREMQRNSEVP
jgi:hypothetical protein